jgi:hypothetical protein
MTIAMQPIYTQTVGSGGASQIVFNNIPQTFTDLKAVVSVRNNSSAGLFSDGLGYQFNGDTSSVYSLTQLYGTGTSVASSRSNPLAFAYGGPINTTNSTASTFTSVDVYIPNYTGNQFKQISFDAAAENNSSACNLTLGANLWRNTAAITSFRFFDFSSASFVQYSTFTLYGITKG